MSNHTHPKEKLNTGHPRALERWIYDTIRQAERNKPSPEWEWATEEADFLLFLEKEIEKNGSIEIEEI